MLRSPQLFSAVRGCLVGLTWMLLAACSRSGEPHATIQAVGRIDARWPDPTAIPVCWMQDAMHDDLKAVVQDRVASEYARAGLRFVGWQTCTAADQERPVVRVEFRAPVPLGDAFTVGCSLIGRTAQPLHGCHALVPGSTMWIVDDRSFDVAASALHEFGHAVGLYHEHERNDRSDCKITDQVIYPSAEIAFLTLYDPDSVMSYCSRQKQLSDGDVRGLRRFYGIAQPPAAPAATAAGLAADCLGADGKTVYANGVVTRYRGQRFTCTNGRWRKGDAD